MNNMKEKQVLSSREETSNTDLLQHFVSMLHLVLEDVREPGTEEPVLLQQLGQALAQITKDYEEVCTMLEKSTNNLISAGLENLELRHAVGIADEVLKSLSAVDDEEILSAALKVLRAEGRAKVEVTTSDTSLSLDVSISFDEENLREALAIAITEYNFLAAQKALERLKIRI